MFQSALRQFMPKPIQTYLQEALCEPVANDDNVYSPPAETPYLSLLRHGTTEWGTFGHLSLMNEDGTDNVLCTTLENPWLDNKNKVSCIPNGLYDMRLRTSAVVKRASGGKFKKGWEVCDVPDRTFIMIHPGNWEKDTHGCILVGDQHSIINGVPGVTNSRDTFEALMIILRMQEEWEIYIDQVVFE